jgi:hypothetical protein
MRLNSQPDQLFVHPSDLLSDLQLTSAMRLNSQLDLLFVLLSAHLCDPHQKPTILSYLWDQLPADRGLAMYFRRCQWLKPEDKGQAASMSPSMPRRGYNI